MCGILGAIGTLPSGPADRHKITVARDLMYSRGPDGGGLFESSDGEGDDCFLAHRRLAIQDLSDSGAQPMRSADGRYVIVYNGEVYNTADLRDQLIEQGIRLRSSSDTEIVLEGYATWGNAVLDKLNGMFAFAIWDCDEKQLFLARDRVGIKPLYVSVSERHVAFASDVRALRHLGLGETIDSESLSLYLALGYVPAPRSIWGGITKLEAGTSMSWTAGEPPRYRRYWSAPDDTDFEGRPEVIEELIDTVVEEQLLSDVPIGLFLSGGLDSSLIASSVAALGTAKSDLTAMTVGFPNDDRNNEAPIALRTANALGFDLRRLELDANVEPYADAAVAAMDEPIAYNAIVTQAGISQLAAGAGFKVVLTGDGGDEVFGGYNWHYPAAQASLEPPRASHLRQLGNMLNFKERARQASAARAKAFHKKSPYFEYMRRVFAALRPDEISAVLPNVSETQTEELLREVFERHDAPQLPDKRRLQRIDLYTFCQDVVLPKVDRTGMAYSVEARPPLLDHRIVEWGLSRPISDYDDAFPKNAVRQILKRRGLEFLLSEPKRGFSLKTWKVSGQEKRDAISRSATGIGLSQGWGRRISRRSESYGTKLEALYWLSRWHQYHVGAPE